jgi:hypothetical protein
MTIWVLGDSFSRKSKYNYCDQWMVKVANEFNCDVVSLGLNGSSLEHTYGQFNSIRHNISENDTVIINFTGMNRRWFFKDLPGYNNSVSPRNHEEETEAMKLYRENLNNQEATLLYLTNFLYNLGSLTKKLKLHVILLINNVDLEDFLKSKTRMFPFHIARGTLSEASVAEFCRSYIISSYEEFGMNDPRLNHLCKRNHLILANKIIANIKYGTPIDLMYGFAKSFITAQLLEDQSFIDSELFGGMIYD